MFKFVISSKEFYTNTVMETVNGRSNFKKLITRNDLGIPEPITSNDTEVNDNKNESSYGSITGYICYTDSLHINLLNMLDRIKYPEINYYLNDDGSLKAINEYAYIIGTNDGLMIFNFGRSDIDGSDSIVVYDLFMDYNPDYDPHIPNSKNPNIFDDIDGNKDISNQIYMIENLKYVSLRVHKLRIIDGKIIPEVKFIDDEGLYHYFVDMYIPSNNCDVDEYGYYYNAKSDFNFDNMLSATFLKTSQILVSDTPFTNAISNGSYYTTTISNNELFSLSFAGYSGDVYICV